MYYSHKGRPLCYRHLVLDCYSLVTYSQLGLTITMSNMLSALVEITGTRPLLLNRFGPDSIPLARGERTGVAGNDPAEWKRRVCWNSQRQICLEAPTVFASIRDGGRFTKKGRSNIQ